MGNRLYVGNLPYAVRDSELAQVFTPFGTVTHARVMLERDTGRSKGFGFVEMLEESQADAAISALHGQPLGGRNLVVSAARPMQPRPPSPPPASPARSRRAATATPGARTTAFAAPTARARAASIPTSPALRRRRRSAAQRPRGCNTPRTWPLSSSTCARWSYSMALPVQRLPPRVITTGRWERTRSCCVQA